MSKGAAPSANGGGGVTTANMQTNATESVIIQQNEEWPGGDVDGFKNNRNYHEANEMFGADVYAHYNSSPSQHEGATREWLESLTAAEKKGTRHYTDMYYDDMNAFLRGQKSTITVTDKKAIEQTQAALSKGILPEAAIMHRGSTAHLITGTAKCTLADIQARIGEVVTDNAFVSSSAVKGEGWTHEPVQYHIKTPAGKGIGAYVDPISANKGSTESEFLFQRSSSFRIVGAYQDSNGRLHCNMEYVGNALGL